MGLKKRKCENDKEKGSGEGKRETGMTFPNEIQRNAQRSPFEKKKGTRRMCERRMSDSLCFVERAHICRNLLCSGA